jgi:hypothetical protein
VDLGNKIVVAKNLPANSFHNGQRTLRIDNRVNNILGTETTYAEGVYYAEGLQTTAQTINYSSSPASAKGTFTSTTYRYNVLIADHYDPYDPVAQTFIVDKTNYPNGIFLSAESSVKDGSNYRVVRTAWWRPAEAIRPNRDLNIRLKVGGTFIDKK